MLLTIFYLILVSIELLVMIAGTLYILSLIYSYLRGSFYVGTKQKEVDAILKEIPFKKGQKLLDIGSGDGRVSITTAKKYGVFATGVEINPVLIFWSRFKAKKARVSELTTFLQEDVANTNLKDFNVIYIFLMPKLIAKVEPRLKKEAKHALIISHGFKIPDWDKYIVKTIDHKPFPTYFYKLKS